MTQSFLQVQKDRREIEAHLFRGLGSQPDDAYAKFPFRIPDGVGVPTRRDTLRCTNCIAVMTRCHVGLHRR